MRHMTNSNKEKAEPTSRLKPVTHSLSIPPNSDPTIFSLPNSNIVDFQKFLPHVRFHGPYLVYHKTDVKLKATKCVKDYVNVRDSSAFDEDSEMMMGVY